MTKIRLVAPASGIISGRSKGAELRGKNHLNNADSLTQRIEIFVPADVVTISASFFGGLLRETMLKCGKPDIFHDRVQLVFDEALDPGSKEAISGVLHRELRRVLSSGVSLLP